MFFVRVFDMCAQKTVHLLYHGQHFHQRSSQKHADLTQKPQIEEFITATTQINYHTKLIWL